MVLVGDCARRWGRRARRAVSVRAVARVDAREVLISSQLCRPAHENTRDGGSGGHAGNQEIKVESTAVRGLPVCCPWAVWSGEFWAQADGWAVQSQRRTWTVRSNWPQRNERDTQQRQPRCCARLGVCEVKKLRECEGGLQVAWKRDKVCQGQRKSTAPRNCTGPCKCSTSSSAVDKWTSRPLFVSRKMERRDSVVFLRIRTDVQSRAARTHESSREMLQGSGNPQGPSGQLLLKPAWQPAVSGLSAK
jgi:hypothetical protein